MVFLWGPPWWKAMFGDKGGDARPNGVDERCGRTDRAQNNLVLKNVGGGERGAEVWSNYCDFFFSFLFSHFS